MDAYDFTRFTASGHRWLFRRFEQIDAGVGSGSGAGAGLAWSVRYFVRSFVGNRIAMLVALPLLLLRHLDRFAHPRRRADAARGVFMWGRKSERSLDSKGHDRLLRDATGVDAKFAPSCLSGMRR